MRLTEEFRKTRNGRYRKGSNTYILHAKCIGCGESFLSRSDYKGQFYCTNDCHNRNYVFTQEHLEKSSESHKGYVMPEEQKKKISEHHKKNGSYCMENLINYRKSHTLPKGEAAFRMLFGKYKKRALKMGFSFSIDKEKFRELVQKQCFYCGCEPKQFYKNGAHNGHFFYNGLDRVDNEIGYTVENVVPSCGQCNAAKRHHSLNDFCNWVERIYFNLDKIKFWGK